MKNHSIRAPFFEIGPKSYLYGKDVLDLALAADAAAEKYGVDIIFTCPVVDIRAVAQATRYIHVFAPHMDPLYPGRGLADTLPESLVAAGAEGVMLNHVEKPVDFETLAKTIKRAEEVGLTTIVCADSGLADALSTALFLLPQEEGQALLEKTGAEALWVNRAGEIFYSPGFRDHIRT